MYLRYICDQVSVSVSKIHVESILPSTAHGGVAHLQDAPKYIFNKNAPDFFIFLPRTLLGRLSAAIKGSSV